MLRAGVDHMIHPAPLPGAGKGKLAARRGRKVTGLRRTP